MVGQTISHYKVLEKIGSGGMGDVYRAHDTKLNRDVALKILPQQFASDSQRMARFQREAEVLASLDHPNIGQIYGIEEAGQTKALVLQLIEGPTLAEKIAQGPIPVEDALKIALQMAEGLEAAHEKGVIHRDLKPANIKITPEGQVKILDFGLAKALEGETPVADLSQSPTLTHAATQAGVILGTAAYMSPEQARGENADQRADVWAFGVVLFEMLTGRRTFEGRTVSDVLAAVLAKEPQWNSLPDNLHPRLRQLLERCLSKEVRDRYTGVGDARVDIETVLADPSGVLVQPVAEVVQAAPQSKLPWVAAVIIGIVAGVVAWNLSPAPPLESSLVRRFSHLLTADERITDSDRQVVVLSPDGSRIVYAANEQLYMRTMDALESNPISGTDEQAEGPFFSPDGQWIAYFSIADSQLKKITLSGGAPVTICDQPDNLNFGASWGKDNMIVFGRPEGILRVSANGGTPVLIVEAEAGEQVYGPQVLPDGEWVLFTATTVAGANRWDEAQIVVQSLNSGERRVLWEGGSDARYIPTGHLVFAVEEVLYAMVFDVDSLEVVGGPVSLIEEMARVPSRSTETGTAHFSFSDGGSLVYLKGTGIASGVGTLVMVDREGSAQSFTDELRNYQRPRVSPDSSRVAVEVTETIGDTAATHIWIVNIETGNGTQLTFEGSQNQFPVWTRNSQTVVFRSDRSGGIALYRKSADGSGEAALVFEGSSTLVATDVLPDGTLVLQDSTDGGNDDIWTLQMDGDGSPSEFLATPALERSARFSPDGGWIAYVSDESGQPEVYVRPYPRTGGGQRHVSEDSGGSPIWSPDGRELYYTQGPPPIVWSVPIQTSPNLLPGRPQELFAISGKFQFNAETRIAPLWDVTPDGTRFVFVQPATQTESEEQTGPQINIILNWFEELKERVPVP